MKYPIIMLCFFLFACKQRVEYPKGGFDYPKHVDDKDTNFYCYPIKDSLSRKDSFLEATRCRFYKEFNEPNLSLRPFGKDVFRFFYGEALGGYFYLISLTEEGINVKKANIPGLLKTDENNLNKLQLEHLNLLRWYFPFEETIQHRPRRKKYLDSLVKLYPQLLDVNYFKKLEDKIIVLKKPFVFNITKITLASEKYRALINEINTSGYWQLPYDISVPNCNDGFGYSLEANTTKQYKIVKDGNCGDSSKFSKACQKLIDYAGLGKEIHVYHDPNRRDTSKSQIFIQDVQLESMKSYKKRNRRK